MEILRKKVIYNSTYNDVIMILVKDYNIGHIKIQTIQHHTQPECIFTL